MTLNQQDYNQYTYGDFMNDDDFIAWILGHDTTYNWDEFLHANPKNIEELLKAKELIQAMHRHYEDQKLPGNEVDREWNTFRKRAENIPSKPVPAPRSDLHIVRRWIPTAAAAALILAIGLWFLLPRPTQETTFITHATHNGEIKSLYLPDSTRVFLNANSTLKLPSDFDPDQVRQVELSGEAYFDVVSARSPANPFVIHTPLSNVHVLGTSFNLKAAPDRTQLALEEGMVDLHFQSPAQEPVKTRVIPGEMVTLKESKEVVVRQLPDIARFSNWKSGYFSYTNEPLTEVLEDMERQFGILFREAPDEMNHRNLSGIVSSTDLEEAISILEATLAIDITAVNDTTYTIQK